MEISRVAASAVPESKSRKGKYRDIWVAIEALGNSGDAVAIKGMSAQDVQRFRSAARLGIGRNQTLKVRTRFSDGVLYVTVATDAAVPTVREFAAVR